MQTSLHYVKLLEIKTWLLAVADFTVYVREIHFSSISFKTILEDGKFQGEEVKSRYIKDISLTLKWDYPARIISGALPACNKGSIKREKHINCSVQSVSTYHYQILVPCPMD